MLEIVNSDFLKATNYLIDNYPTDKRLIVHVMEGYDTIETPTGKGFGVFIPEKLEIFIAGDMPGESKDLIKTLAHEFKHFYSIATENHSTKRKRRNSRRKYIKKRYQKRGRRRKYSEKPFKHGVKLHKLT